MNLNFVFCRDLNKSGLICKAFGDLDATEIDFTTFITHVLIFNKASLHPLTLGGVFSSLPLG